MRDAFTAQPDDDFDLPAVVRPRPAARSAGRSQRAAAKPKRRPGIGERVAAFALNHPRQILAALFLTGCGGVIAWNALALQRAHHPAPLFTQRTPAAEPVTVPAQALAQPLPPARPGAESPEVQAFIPQPPAPQVASALPAPAPAPAAPKPPSRSPIAELIRNGGDPGTVERQASRTASAPQTAAAAPAPARAPVATDPIAEMIRMGGPVPRPPANVGRADPGDIVLAGQRALAKLGYGVKVDGYMGAGTRQAIERFEQDRHLPMTGEFNARTTRELSALSGIAVQ